MVRKSRDLIYGATKRDRQMVSSEPFAFPRFRALGGNGDSNELRAYSTRLVEAVALSLRASNVCR